MLTVCFTVCLMKAFSAAVRDDGSSSSPESSCAVFFAAASSARARLRPLTISSGSRVILLATARLRQVLVLHETCVKRQRALHTLAFPLILVQLCPSEHLMKASLIASYCLI